MLLVPDGFRSVACRDGAVSGSSVHVRSIDWGGRGAGNFFLSSLLSEEKGLGKRREESERAFSVNGPKGP